MIGQIDIEKSLLNAPNDRSLFVALASVVNSLVDAVNELQESQNTYWTDIAEIKKELQTRAENVQDKFAEQRKWIGYLCWFWDDDYDLKTDGVLEDITTIEEEFHYAKKDTCTVWKHCEPVKPDDDIIYKGGNNE